ncbi:MAG: ribosome biogenesis GTPase YlqF [Neisseriaceae bacterium]|nr:ribosome biogenesis GTPase YlqF [Neisseriaceae bacterium]
MSIQWFPGHMNKAKKAIAERMNQIDVVIEMTDARFPASCISPLLAKTSAGKTQLKILNKSDLADENLTQEWIGFFKQQQKTDAIALSAHDKNIKASIIRACRQLVPHRGGMDKPLRVMICGVPNVGKSTLINTLIGKKSAKTGNEPGITKAEQRLILADDFWLYDTPGMLWQKIIVPESGYNLAIGGSVGRNALDEEDIVLYLIHYLKMHYPTLLAQRYQLSDFDEHMHDDVCLEQIARKRGALISGGRIDYQKASELVLQDFRSGLLGRITLETPEEWSQWLKSAQAIEAEKKRQREQAKKEKHS